MGFSCSAAPPLCFSPQMDVMLNHKFAEEVPVTIRVELGGECHVRSHCVSVLTTTTTPLFVTFVSRFRLLFVLERPLVTLARPEHIYVFLTQSLVCSALLPDGFHHAPQFASFHYAPHSLSFASKAPPTNDCWSST